MGRTLRIKSISIQEGLYSSEEQQTHPAESISALKAQSHHSQLPGTAWPHPSFSQHAGETEAWIPGGEGLIFQRKSSNQGTPAGSHTAQPSAPFGRNSAHLQHSRFGYSAPKPGNDIFAAVFKGKPWVFLGFNARFSLPSLSSLCCS